MAKFEGLYAQDLKDKILQLPEEKRQYSLQSKEEYVEGLEQQVFVQYPGVQYPGGLITGPHGPLKISLETPPMLAPAPPTPEPDAPHRLYRLSLSRHRATKGAIQLGSIIRMRPGGGKFFIFALPRNILPERDHIEAPFSTRVSYNALLETTPKAKDLRLWEGFTGLSEDYKTQPRGGGERAPAHAREPIVFKSITTEEWQPDEAYLKAARGLPLPTWQDPHYEDYVIGLEATQVYEDYLVTGLKFVNGARIPTTRDKGPERHDDVGLAARVEELLRARAGGHVEEEDPEKPQDILMAFSVRPLQKMPSPVQWPPRGVTYM